MTSLKCWKSGVESKDGSFIDLPSLSLADRSTADPISTLLPSAIPSTGIGFARDLPGKLFVGDSTTHNLFHADGEPLRVRHLAMVVSKALLVRVSLQVERLNRNIRALQGSFE
jgi:hypothetical protein